MPCYRIKMPVFGGSAIICGKLGPHCRAPGCGGIGDHACDWPVGKGKTCDKPLCEEHAQEIGPDLHYCAAHAEMWREYRDSGGTAKDLQNVLAFGRPKN